MNNLIPQCTGIDLFFIQWFSCVNRELLVILFVLLDSLHKLIVDLDRNIRTGYFSGFDFSIDKVLCIWMFDRKGQHQSSPTAILSHLSCRIRITFHKGNNTGRGEGTVQYGAAGRTDMRQIVSHTTTTFHQLHLLLVDPDDTSV